MNAELNTLISLVSIFLIFIYLFWIYRDYRIDLFRQKIFQIRDQFFDDAAEAGIPYDHPAYGMLRKTMNGTIRFAHRLNLVYVIIIKYFLDKNQNRVLLYHKKVKESTHDLTPDQLDLIKKYRQELNFLVVEHLIFVSPFAASIALVILFFGGLQKLINKTTNIFKGPLDKLGNEAFITGSKSHSM